MVNPVDRSRASTAYLALVGTSVRQLRATMRAGHRPDVDGLSGWEWRGTNLPATSRLLGIRRFIKGFEEADGRRQGYNVSVTGSDVTAPWTERRQRDGRREWARFTVTPVDRRGHEPHHPNAVLLDYGAVESPEPGLAARLRDYVVSVSPESDDLLLGQAYLTVGSALVPVGWFALERLQPVQRP